MATYVLLPGAWSGAWQWRTVARLLQADRHDVFTPTLTGLGERVHLASPSVDLTTHVDDVVNVLTYEDLRDVVLVGFSYSGLVATAVAERVPDRLAHLVYLDAFVPQHGQSLMDMIGPEAATYFEHVADERGDGWRIPHDPPDAPRRTDHPLKTFQGPVAVRNSDALAVPRTYIYCSDKAEMGAGGAGITESAARARAAGWRYRELPTTHVAMETMPRELADLLHELVWCDGWCCLSHGRDAEMTLAIRSHDLLRLLQFADSGFPTGAFAFSHGLEGLFDAGLVRSEAEVIAFARTQIEEALAGIELPAARHAHRFASSDNLDTLLALDNELTALKPVPAFRVGSVRTGRRFLESTADLVDAPFVSEYRAAVVAGNAAGHHALAFAIVAQAAGLDEETMTLALGAGAVGALAAAAVRLGIIGQGAAQRAIAALHPDLLAAVIRAREMPLDAMGAYLPMVDIAGLRQESLPSRLFAS